MTDVVSQYVSGRTVQEQMSELMKFVSTVNGKSVKKIEGTQSDDTVTVTVTYEDNRTDVFSFQSTLGVTVDTAQTISGMKVFSAASTQFTHDVDVGGDLNVATTVEANELTVDTDATVDGNMTVDGNLDVGGNVKITGKINDDVVISSGHSLEMENAGAVETSNNDIVISPAGRLLVKTSNGQDLEAVFSSSNGLQVDKIAITTQGTAPTPAVTDSTAKIETSEGVDAKLDAYSAMVRTTGEQLIDGKKSFNKSINNCSSSAAGANTGWRRIYFSTNINTGGGMLMVTPRNHGNNYAKADFGLVAFTFRINAEGYSFIEQITKPLTGGSTSFGLDKQLIMGVRDNVFEIWFKRIHGDRDRCNFNLLSNYGDYVEIDSTSAYVDDATFQNYVWEWKKNCVVASEWSA